VAKTANRLLNLLCVFAILITALGILPPEPVVAQGFSTPPQINGFFNPDTIYPSQTSRLTINVYNPNPFQLTAVNWIDHLPDDLVVVDPPNPTVAGCGSGYTLVATAGNDFISLSGATTLGTTDPATPGICSVTVSVTSFDDGNHTNIIDRDTDGSVIFEGEVAPTLYEKDANITILVLPMSSPTIAKSFAPNNIDEGETSRLTVNIVNNDPIVPLTQVNVTDLLPAGMRFNAPSSGLLHSGCGTGAVITADDVSNTLTLAGGTIAVSSTCTISVDVVTTGTGTFTNIIHPADMTTFQKVTIPGNASASLIVKNLVIAKTYSPAQLQLGGLSTLTITLTNPTSSTMTGVYFTDTMDDADVTVENVAGNSDCGGIVDTTHANAVSFSGGEIPAGGICTVTATVRANAVGSHRNYLRCTTIGFDGGIAGCESRQADLNVYDTGLGLSVTKSFNPVNIDRNANTRMTITIRTPADVTSLTNFQLTDNLPLNVVVSSTPNAVRSNCGPASILTASSLASSITLTNATITRGTACTISVNVTTSEYGTHTNVIHAVDLDHPVGDISNNENRNIAADVSGSFTVRDISVTKSFTNSLVGRNGITTLSITLTSNFSHLLTDVEFSDNLPGTLTDGIVIADPNNLNNTCNGTVIANSNTQLIHLSDGSILPNESCTITLDVQGARGSGTPTTTYHNTIDIGDVTGIVDGSTPTQNWHAYTADITVGSPNFRINKKFDPILVTGDTASTMTITLVNTESSPVSEIEFTDTLPDHMLLAVPSSPTVGSCGGVITPAGDRRSFTFTGGALASHGQCQLTIRAMMEITGNLINTIPANSVKTKQGMTNRDLTSATLTNLSSVGVEKHFDPNPVSPGGVSTVILDVQKHGVGIGLTGLGMSDTLEHGLTVANPANVTNTCGGAVTAVAGSTSVTLANGVMPIGTMTCSITFDVLVPASGLMVGGYENCIPVGTIITDQGYTNVIRTCDTLGTLFDPPTGYKVFDASGLPLLEWRMVWINDHNSANINAQIRDDIPAGTTYVPGSLTCEERGISPPHTNCEFDGGANQIFWAGTIGPDRGATNEATANNEIVITFRVNVPNTINLVSNQSPSLTDTNGNSDFTDELTPASSSTSNLATWSRRGPGRGSGSSDAKELPASGFAPGKVTPLSPMPDGIYESLPALILDIPNLDLNTEVVGLSVTNDQWDVSWLGNKLGYLEESAFPTFPGNSIITGHVFDAQGQPGPFNKLNTLRYGDKVIIRSFGQAYTYEVRDVLTVAPNDMKAAFQHQDNSWITLLTCQGYNPDTGIYASRVLVRAVLINVQ
jgi:LPXTG-site transpeptidase (sortase) family protein